MRLYVRMILVVAACGVLPLDARDDSFQDRVELKDGTRLAGDLIELGGAQLEIRMKGGSKTVLRADVTSIVLDRRRPARGMAEGDSVLRSDGQTITGKVEIIAGGQRVRITKPGGSSVLFPRSSVEIIRKGDPIARTRRVYTKELAADIAESLTTLERLTEAEATADASRTAREEAFLVECGIFAIEDVRRILAKDEAARERGDEDGALVGAARDVFRSVDKIYRLKCVVAPEIESYDPNIYKILAYSERQGKVDILFFVFYRFAQEAVPLASFLAREEGEDEVVRAYAVDVLRRLQENRALVDIYRRSTGRSQLACAIALGKNHVLFGVPALIDALEMSDLEIRELAVAHLRQFSGESFRFRPSGAPEARRLAVLRWRGWWSEKQEGLEELSRRILDRGTVETPQQRQALELWRQAALETEDVGAAAFSLRKALEIDPLFFKARIGLAVLELTGNERPDEALKELLEIKAETRPDLSAADRFWVYLYIGHSKRLLGDNKGALDAYRQASSYDIGNVEGMECLGEMAYTVATTEPDVAAAERKANLEMALGAFTRALDQIEAYKEGLETFTINDVPIEEHLRFDRRRHNRDVLGFRKMYRQDSFRYVLHLARTEALLGKRQEAKARLEKSLKDIAPLASIEELHPIEVQIRNLLGVLYEESGNRTQALRQYKFVLEGLDKTNEESRLGIRRLQTRQVGN